MIEIMRRHGLAIAFVALLFGWMFARPAPDDLLRLSGQTMGTTYSIQVRVAQDDVDRGALQQQISDLLQRMDRELFSTYASDSELSRLNRTPIGQPLSVAPELIEVTQMAFEVSELTGGAFDITIGPLVNLWGFGPLVNREQVPVQSAIEEARLRVDYRQLLIDPEAGTLVRGADIYVDMSAIAKGYAVDKLAELLDRQRMENYFIEVGGELKIRGSKPGAEGWVPALERPQDTAPQVYRRLRTFGQALALAGSGDYRNYFEQDGVRYSHEIDPRSGRPVSHTLAAVYVLHESAARADALATAFMILGYEAGREFAERENLAVYFIYRKPDGSFADHHTSSFAPFLIDEE